MKKLIASAIAVGCLAAAGTAIAGLPSGTGVNGSLHDMNIFVGPNADVMGRVCVFCHTPHHAMSNVHQQDGTDVANANMYPLWNHKMTNLTYTAYIWTTPANVGTDSEPSKFQIDDPLAGPSRLCMSCHDGVVAVDQHGEALPQGGSHPLTGRGNLGGDLTETHPIGFDYNKIAEWRNSIAGRGGEGDEFVGTEIALSNNTFATDVTYENAVQGTYNHVTRPAANAKRIKDVLYKGNIMTCASCHEVHNKENAIQTNYPAGTVVPPRYQELGYTTAPNYFLYAKQDKSLICLSCHVK